jgi:hypothetical protein
VASEQRFLAYDFVVRVPLPLDVATERMEKYLRGIRSFYYIPIVRIDGRTFTINYYRWPIPQTDGQIIPNDAGGTDIVVHVRQWEIVLAIYVVIVAVVATFAVQTSLVLVAFLFAALMFYIAYARPRNFQRDIVRTFA